MPLEILVPMVVVGLAIMIGTVHLAGGSQKDARLDEDLARQRFAIDFPDFGADIFFLNDERSCAFLHDVHGDQLGYVQAMGQHCLTRLLKPGSVSDLASGEKRLVVKLKDPTLTKIEFAISDSVQLQELTDLLTSLRGH